jgi:hypothetical protein
VVSDEHQDDAELLDTLAEAIQDRHPSVRDVAQWFAFGHLEGTARLTSSSVCRVAVSMLLTIEDSAELTVGLRKLLEAKDAFVRAAIAREVF